MLVSDTFILVGPTLIYSLLLFPNPSADEEAAEKERLSKLNEEKMGKFALRKSAIEKSSSMAVDSVSEQIEEETKRLDEWKKAMLAGKQALGPMIQKKSIELDKLRLSISDIKKTGEQEDPNFHIDGSRDERGHSFLMMAAQNNDAQTVRTCLKIGAKPMVTNGEGLSAIDYSFRFNFEEVTDLMLQVRQRLLIAPSFCRLKCLLILNHAQFFRVAEACRRGK